MGQLVEGYRRHLALNAERLENRVLVEIRRASHQHNKTYEMHDSFTTEGRYDRNQHAIIVDIESDAPQTIYTNFGTVAHDIPKTPKPYPMKFVWPKNPGFETDALGRVSFWKVRHPGYTGSRWLSNTLERWFQMIADELSRTV
jgi:hypothetical protein